MPLKIPKISTILPCFDCFFLALLPITGTLAYFLYKLDWLSIIASLLISSSLSFFISKTIKKNRVEKKEKESECKLNKFDFLSFSVFLFFTSLSFILLIKSGSEKALISPWQVVPTKFFVFYALSAAALFISLSRKNINQKGKAWLIRLFYFLSFSVCLFIYKAGYGFDPFIHQATMEFIDKHGFIEPKNPYYAGQYSLIIIISKISGLSISFINTWLLAILSAFFLPIAFGKFLKRYKASQTIIPALLALSFSPFIMNAPQNLAYLFLILSILSGLKTKSLLLSSLFAIAATCIHPLAGLPALSFIALSLWQRHNEKLKKKTKNIISILLITGSSLVVPAALYISGGESLSFWQSISSLKTFWQAIFNFNFAGQENATLNFAYLFFYNKILILIFIALTSFFIIKKKNSTAFKNLKAAHLAALSSFLAFIFSSSIKFHDIISYEQNAYGNRLLLIAFLFMIPSITLALSLMAKKISEQNLVVKTIFLIIITITLTASLYISYPRLDKYYNSRGYSTSRYDLAAVQAIEKEAVGKEYAVLANQQVSAAALKEFGFERNIGKEEKIYFYPIPTGGTLYKYYLQAVYNAPTKKTMTEAMDFTEVNDIFLVINKYWNRSAELIEKAKTEANNWQSIKDEVYIFHYKR